MTRLPSFALPTIASACIACFVASRDAAARYVPIRELDSNGLLSNDSPVRISGSIVVGGGSSGGIWSVPAYFDPTNGTTILPVETGYDLGIAQSLNESGVIVGGEETSTFNAMAAVVWNNGVVTDLNTLISGSHPPPYLFWAYEIDDHGRILTYGVTKLGYRAILFDAGTVIDLGSLDPLYGDSYAYSMNQRQIAAGDSSLPWPNVGNHACLFANGQVTDLHDPTFMASDYSSAVDVNRDGHAVGVWYDLSFQAPHAFLWDGSQSIDLVALAGKDFSASALNDFDAVVGNAFDPATRTTTACLWQNGALVDLNTLVDPTLGWVLGAATDIDDAGRITGSGTLNGVFSAWILEPDCKGNFTIYGTGCAGTGGLVPQLRGDGCPAPDRDFALEVRDGLPSGIGLLFLGTGTGTLTVKPGCDLQVLPLVPPVIPLVLDTLGEWWDHENLPAGTPIFDLYLQALFFDPGAAHAISGTKPLKLHFE